MGLKPEYVAGVTDSPTYALTLRMGNATKRVIDYVGREVGMPASVTALEDAVDALAETDRWVRGNAGTIALLKAQGFDFRSKAAAELVQAAIELNTWPPDNASTRELIRAAMVEGLVLDTTIVAGESSRSKDVQAIGTLIAQYAAQTGDEMLFDEMDSRGYVDRMSKRGLNDTFAYGTGCSARIAKALVAAGASPKAQGSDGNALHALRSSYGPCPSAEIGKRVEMARILIALGVPLEARDELGWTPLMGCDDPEIAQVLLNAGADANAQDKDGTTPILSVDDDRVAILLLRAGANPRAKDKDGTVRDQARKYHWPATLSWLDAHGIP